MNRARAARREKIRHGPPVPAAAGASAIPRHWLKWLRISALALAAICLLGWFSNETQDTDFWWHLKTGQYVVQQHSLPLPDPFAYTTSIVAPKHPEEELVRHFNLTHEWVAQGLMYVVYLIGGFPLIILVRAALLGGMCALAGFLAARLSKNFYVGIAAAFAAASLAIEFRADRPALVTFLFVAVFVTILELRVFMWALPPLALIWANCHGGFFLGWVVLLAYCVETLPLGKWLRRAEDFRKLWIVTCCSIAASLINPNGIAVVSTVLQYRKSPMTANLLEWHPPYLWGPPYAFDILLYTSVVALIVSWRKVRPVHWALFLAFAGASLTAFRNIPLIAFLAPVWIAAYLVPRLESLLTKVAPLFRRAIPFAAPFVLAVAIVVGVFQDWFFQLRVASWTTPAGAADFLVANHITGRMFNTWAQGGYLMWRLWPQESVFIDGRALSESLNRDYQQILNNLPGPIDKLTGPRKELLDRYGVQVVVMNTIEFVSGGIYPLAVALGSPETTEWQLVYDDPQALVFMRNPPPGISAVANKMATVILHMESECKSYVEHSPDTPNCGLALFDFWMRGVNGAKTEKEQTAIVQRALPMLRLYLAHTPERNPQAEAWWQRLTGAPFSRP